MNTIRDKLFDLNKSKESFAELNPAEQFTITNTNAEKQTSLNSWAKQHKKLLTNGLLFISRANRIYHSAEQHMSSSVNSESSCKAVTFDGFYLDLITVYSWFSNFIIVI